MIAKGSPSITIEDVHRKFSDFDIAHRYLGITCVPEVITSPLRQDRNPSLSIFEGSRDRDTLVYCDHGTGELGSIFILLCRMWNLPLNETLKRIMEDMPEPAELTKSRVKIFRRSSGKIEVKIREWRKHDIEYWSSYGISLPWLKFGNIYPISHIIITKGNSTYPIPAEKYAYVYIERKDNHISFKIYQPFSKEFKWMSKHDSSVWDLWTKIPERGSKLIITSSRKDALCIWSNTGIPSLSLQGEGYIPKEHVVQQLKDRYRDIYILYDNDFQSDVNHGRIYGKTITDRFGLKQIEIPEEYGSKDSSDLYHNRGKETLIKVINTLINS